MTLDLAAFVDLPEKVQAMLEAVATDGAKLGAEQLSGLLDSDAFDSLVRLVNERAVALAADRAAAMVGMKWVDGVLVENPNALWSISESTRELIRGDVSQALQEGWSNTRLRDALMDPENAAFSEYRASMVASTELANMDLEANRAAWRESGIVRKAHLAPFK